jgi:hypothetical protein
VNILVFAEGSEHGFWSMSSYRHYANECVLIKLGLSLPVSAPGDWIVSCGLAV